MTDTTDATINADLVGPGGLYEIVEDMILGVPTEVFRNREKNIVEILHSGAKRFADRPYLVFPDRQFTFASIITSIAPVAKALHDDYGVRRGDRVAIASANRAEYVLTFWATTALGGITAALNGWWTGPEMAYAIELTEPKLIVGDSLRLSRLAARDLKSLPILNLESDFSDLEASGSGASFPEVPLDEDDPFLILFTSGTTGRVKGATLSHRANIHFDWSTRLRSAQEARNARLRGAAPTSTPLPCRIGSSPMFHVSGLTTALVLAPGRGMTIVYPPPGRWSEETHLRLTEKHRCTSWSLVPTQLWRLLDWPDLGKYDLSSVSSISGGSAVWPPSLLRRVEEQLPWVRPGISLGYGMTETTGLGTTLTSRASYEHADSIGWPSPGLKLEIRDPSTHEVVPEGTVGEIAMQSASCFLSYWRNPTATATVLDQQRWYHTGDFGHIKDGLVYLDVRRTDLIIRGGENIYPTEIENRLFEHDEVLETAVVGAKHRDLGQEVVAYVVAKLPLSIDAVGLQQWCAVTLAAFKVPSRIIFVDELPHNATGKVLKHLLGNPHSESDFTKEE